MPAFFMLAKDVLSPIAAKAETMRNLLIVLVVETTAAGIVTKLATKESATNPRINQGISFAYEPISKCKEGLATFSIEGNAMSGEFNFVYFNRDIALSKIRTIFGDK